LESNGSRSKIQDVDFLSRYSGSKQPFVPFDFASMQFDFAWVWQAADGIPCLFSHSVKKSGCE
jgi:hypothetical protein